mmetsp:Transcript_30343/g.59418  ORF Transcript_30343/g.59418 Transcript_30343/m.59418 type:complete len:235 (-) Transcript_30343:454-1158(-)
MQPHKSEMQRTGRLHPSLPSRYDSSFLASILGQAGAPQSAPSARSHSVTKGHRHSNLWLLLLDLPHRFHSRNLWNLGDLRNLGGLLLSDVLLCLQHGHLRVLLLLILWWWWWFLRRGLGRSIRTGFCRLRIKLLFLLILWGLRKLMLLQGRCCVRSLLLFRRRGKASFGDNSFLGCKLCIRSLAPDTIWSTGFPFVLSCFPGPTHTHNLARSCLGSRGVPILKGDLLQHWHGIL